MSGFSVDEYRRLLGLARDAQGEQERGRTLEALVCYLLNAMPGLSVIAVDVRTQAEEVDIVAHNGRQDPAFAQWEPVVFVECKNWSRPVGKSEMGVVPESGMVQLQEA